MIWYQAMDAHDDKPIGEPQLAIEKALRVCLTVTFNTEIRELKVGNIAAVIQGGELVGGTPEAIEAARARGILADEGR